MLLTLTPTRLTLTETQCLGLWPTSKTTTTVTCSLPWYWHTSKTTMLIPWYFETDMIHLRPWHTYLVYNLQNNTFTLTHIYLKLWHTSVTTMTATCWTLTLIVTLPLVILRMLKPTVGIMSSLNWPDCNTEPHWPHRHLHVTLWTHTLLVQY